MADKPTVKGVSSGTTLDGALLRAQENLAFIVKDAHNDYSNYDYVSAESMLTACRKALHTAGLALSPHGQCPKVENQEGVGLTVQRSWHLSHPASGETRVYDTVFPLVPGKKPLDKAMLSILTTGLSYFLRDLLQVPRPEEEVDTRDDRNVEPAVVKPPPARIPTDMLEKIDMLRHAASHTSSMGGWSDDEIWNFIVKRAKEDGAELGPKYVTSLINKAHEAAKAKDLRDLNVAINKNQG